MHQAGYENEIPEFKDYMSLYLQKSTLNPLRGLNSLAACIKAPFRGFGGENPVNIVAIPEYANPPLTALCEYFFMPYF